MKAVANELNSLPNRKCLLVSLKNYSNTLNNTIKVALGWSEPQDGQVIDYLEKYEIVLLLDGLNEVTNKDLERCTNEVQTLLETYKGQVCISYPSSDHAYFGFACPTYTPLPLTQEQIEKTINNFFLAKGTPQKSDWFLKSVRGWNVEERQDFDNLAKLPINLQFLLELADADNFVFSGNRDLYGQLIQKRLERTKVYSQRNQISVDVKTEC